MTTKIGSWNDVTNTTRLVPVIPWKYIKVLLNKSTQNANSA